MLREGDHYTPDYHYNPKAHNYEGNYDHYDHDYDDNHEAHDYKEGLQLQMHPVRLREVRVPQIPALQVLILRLS